jgi:putative chitinase
MCISNSVGNGGVNAANDVRCIQLLLNMNRDRCGLASDLKVDGAWGPSSAAALATFCKAIGARSDTPVTANDEILDALRRGLPPALVRQKLWIVMTSAQAARIDDFFNAILATMNRYQINTPLRIAHFLAQIAHESGCLRYTEEIASGEAYEGRVDLGNTQPGDGPLFKGRGLIQLTGRANYRDYGKACGKNFETTDKPTLVATDPDLAVDVAGWFWDKRQLNALADRDDLREITRRVNGGFNGLAERADFLARAKWLLVRDDAPMADKGAKTANGQENSAA